MKKLIVVVLLCFCVIMCFMLKPGAEINRYTEIAKQSAEKATGMSEAEEQARLSVLLKEVNRILGEEKDPIVELKKKIVKQQEDIDTLLEMLAELEETHNDDVDTIMELMGELEERVSEHEIEIDNNTGNMLRNKQELLIIESRKTQEDRKRLEKIAEDL